jgi:protein-S-isoprenylcysteine O-methyltransferase Ste14
MENFDLINLTLVMFVGIGVVNVISFFKPNIDSRIKFVIAFVAVLAITFIPVELGSIILEKVKIALEVALASSGIYKIAQKAGGQ